MSISIHAPREGCDGFGGLRAPSTGFQSTHPVRGATWNLWHSGAGRYISIHAPREGCDNAGHVNDMAYIFQSTHPVRGATGFKHLRLHRVRISIHAPREGCERGHAPLVETTPISIHAPREGCEWNAFYQSLGIKFQSTHPVRGAIVRHSRRLARNHFNPRTP